MDRMIELLMVRPAVQQAKIKTEAKMLRDLLTGEATVLGVPAHLEFDGPCVFTKDELIAMVDKIIAF